MDLQKIVIDKDSFFNLTYSFQLYCTRKYLKFLVSDLIFLGLLLANLFNILVKFQNNLSNLYGLQINSIV